MNSLKILKLFVENKNKVFTIKKVSETLKINYKIVYQEIHKLENITIEKQGNSKLCKFNNKFTSELIEIENQRIENLQKDIKLIKTRTNETNNPFYCLLLFGSRTNTNSKQSDIDICLITDNEKISKQIQTTINTIPLNIDLQEFTTEQFKQMINRKNYNLGNEIINNNIILHGIENYYEMINNANE